MKILPPSIYGFNRRLSFVRGADKELFDVELKYTGESSCSKAVILDNEVIPYIVKAVNSHEELINVLASLIEMHESTEWSESESYDTWLSAKELLKKVAQS